MLHVEKDDTHATLSDGTYQIYISSRNIFKIRIQNGYINTTCSEDTHVICSKGTHLHYIIKGDISKLHVQKEALDATCEEGRHIRSILERTYLSYIFRRKTSMLHV